MRVRTTGLAFGLLVLLGATGCGSGGGGGNGVASADGSSRPTASGSGTGGAQSGREGALQFARCMRANGIPNFPDPTDNGGNMQVMLPQGVDPQTGKAANEKCKQYLPNGGALTKPDPQFVAKMLAYAKCMRAHGVTNFPDPDPNGGTILDQNKIGMSPTDPVFKAADQACASARPGGQVHTATSGGSSGGPGSLG